MTTHEPTTSFFTLEDKDLPSNRSFGFTIGLVLLLIALFPLFMGETRIHGGAFVVGSLFALAAMAFPHWLTPLNRAWMKLGMLLGKIISPIALGILFYGVFTPMGALARAFGKDLLRLKKDPEATSYWIPRDPPGPDLDTFRKPF